MLKQVLLLVLVSLTAVSVPTRTLQTASPPSVDVSKLVDYLKWSQQLVENETAKLTPQQWSYKPAADRWSVAECVEHLALAEETIRGVVDRALSAPAVEPADAPTVRERDQIILRLASDRSQKFNAPERLKPSGSPPQEMLKKLRELRQSNIAFAQATPIQVMRGHAADHPLFKNADVYQWMLLAASHVERHVNQIREIKATTGFPK